MNDVVEVGGDLVEFQVTSERSGGAMVAYEVEFAPGAGKLAAHGEGADVEEVMALAAASGIEITRPVAELA